MTRDAWKRAFTQILRRIGTQPFYECLGGVRRSRGKRRRRLFHHDDERVLGMIVRKKEFDIGIIKFIVCADFGCTRLGGNLYIGFVQHPGNTIRDTEPHALAHHLERVRIEFKIGSLW